MRYFIAIIGASIGLAITAHGATINVPGDYPTIQGAVDAASGGDEIIVGPGTYSINAHPWIDKNRAVINTLGKAIAIRSSDGAQSTIVSGLIPSGPDCAGLVCINGEGQDTIIEGLTFIDCKPGDFDFDGDGQDSPWEDQGSAIAIYHSSPTIIDCVFRDNDGYDAGAIYIYSHPDTGLPQCSPVIRNCLFDSNKGNNGGAITNRSADLLIEDCNFVNNYSVNGNGGAIFNYCIGKPGSICVIRSCNFTGNNTTNIAGAIYWCDTVGLTVEDCQFIGNYAGRGGAIYTGGSQGGNWNNLVFESNSSSQEGGAIYFSNEPPSIIDMAGMTFGSNFSGFMGGAVYITGDEPRIRFSDSLFCDNAPTHIHGPYMEGENVLFRDECELGACCTNEICVIASGEDCNTFGGDWLGEETTCDDSPCPSTCLGDTDGDGEVNVNDILLVIARWGVTCP